MSDSSSIESAFRLAEERYAEWDVKVGDILEALERIPLSLHCWQGDDVGGFENSGQALGDGLAVTGNYPGKARSPEELRQDLEKVFSLLPAITGSIYTPSMASSEEGKSIAMKLRQSIFRVGSIGRKRIDLGSTSILPSSPILWRGMDLP